MDNRQEAKLDMYRAVQQVLADNQAITADKVAFTNTSNAFSAKISAIISMGTLEKEVITGVAENKNEQKANLAQNAANMAAIVFAFANATNSDVLKNQTDYTEADLKKLKDNELPLVCNNIITAAQDNLAALADYGITAAMVTTLQTILTNYSGAVPLTKSAKSVKSSQVKNLAELFKETDALLKKQVDKLVVSYKSSAPDFVNTYKSARVIIDPATRKPRLKAAAANVA